jgi:urease accessory protein
MVWLSPAFPVGAFAYSHGLEWACEVGDIRDAATLTAWLRDLLEHGSLRNDAILCACAFRAAASGDEATLVETAEYALALTGSAERRLETVTQGNAFVIAARAAWPCPTLDRLKVAVPGDVAYPVALGVTAAGHGLPLLSTLEAFGLGIVANLISAAVRLGAIGQTDGQRVTAALMPASTLLAHEAQDAGLDAIGGCALRSDIAALRHETQYSRLFRS